MRTAVIFALVIATFVAATSAAPSPKSNNLKKFATLLASKIRSGHKATAVLPHGPSDSEIIEQAIVTTEHVTRSLAHYLYYSRQMKTNFPAEEYDVAYRWWDDHRQRIVDAWGDVIWDILWADDRSPEVVRARAEEAAASIELALLSAGYELINESNLMTFAIKMHMTTSFAGVMHEINNDIGDLWGLIKGTGPVERESHVVQRNWNQLISNPQQAKNYFEDLKAQATETLAQTTEALVSMLESTEELFNYWNDKDEVYDQFADGMLFYAANLIELININNEVIIESYEAADSAAVDAIVDKAMSDYADRWRQIIPDAQALTPLSYMVAGEFGDIVGTYLYRYTVAMESLIQMLRIN